MLRYALALLPLLSLLGAALSAQAPFAELRPSGALQPASLLQRGKMLVYPEPGRVSIYSAFRQRWLSIPVQGVPTIRHANDWVLVRDGARWTAVGSYRFVPESLVLSGAAAELNPPSQRNDSLLLVQDGADVHAFSGFTGKWHSRRPGSNFAFAVQRHCAVIARQDELLGISAFDGQWRSQAVRGQAHSLAADGTLGLAELGGELWGFSAETRSWAKHAALPGAALRIVGADVAVWHDATRCVAFSGLRGRFVQQAIPAISSVLVQRKFALVQTRGAVQAFSGPLASWSQLVPAAPLRMRDSSGLALLIEAGRVLAYSALRGDFAALTHGAAREELGAAVAIVQDAGTGQWFYSGFDGLWRAQPANALGVAAQGGYATALLRIAGGVVAFSAKSGAFVPLSCSANAMLHADTGSSVIAVAEAGSLHVFDPRRERWRSASVAAQRDSQRADLAHDYARRGRGRVARLWLSAWPPRSLSTDRPRAGAVLGRQQRECSRRVWGGAVRLLCARALASRCAVPGVSSRASGGRAAPARRARRSGRCLAASARAACSRAAAHAFRRAGTGRESALLRARASRRERRASTPRVAPAA
jgi:hypothetical protein